MIYAAKKWENYLVDGFAKYVEEKYQEKFQGWLFPCEFLVTEVIANNLFVYRFFSYLHITNIQTKYNVVA